MGYPAEGKLLDGDLSPVSDDVVIIVGTRAEAYKELRKRKTSLFRIIRKKAQQYSNIHQCINTTIYPSRRMELSSVNN